MKICLLIILSLLCTILVAVAGTDKEYIYITMNIDDTPIIDYEGDSLRRSGGFTGDGKGNFDLSLIILDIDLAKEKFILNGENDTKEKQIINMTGTLERIGDSGVNINLKINSRVSGVVQFAMMNHEKDPKNEFPEISFTPGFNEIHFSGKVLGWFEKEK